MGFILKKSEFVIGNTGIDNVERITIGGIKQSILIQAENPANPVLLFVHGGPCMPIPGVVSRGQDYAIATTTKELVKHFVVVFWDQRGCGKSYNKKIPAESMRVEQFISDCNELIDILRERFHQEKIYLAAHSWGTVIGLSIANKYPEKLHAYVGISQLLNWAKNDMLCYEWVKNRAQEANDKKTLKKLEELGLPPYVKSTKQWIAFRLPLMKHKSMIYENERIKNPGMMGGLKLFLNSREYSLKDIFNTLYGAYNITYTQEMIEDFAKINLDLIKKISVPIYFLHGRQDFHVNSKPLEEFYNALDAPFGKKMVFYENSSHMFYPEDARDIEKFIIETAKN